MTPFCEWRDVKPSSYGSARPAPSSSYDNVSRTGKTFHVGPFHGVSGEKIPQAQDPRKAMAYALPQAPHFGMPGTSLEGRHIDIFGSRPDPNLLPFMNSALIQSGDPFNLTGPHHSLVLVLPRMSLLPLALSSATPRVQRPRATAAVLSDFDRAQLLIVGLVRNNAQY